MANMTLSIPDELMEKMRRFREIRWSEIARQAIQSRVEALERMNKIADKSKLTEKDVEEMGKKIKSAVAKRFSEYNN